MQAVLKETHEVRLRWIPRQGGTITVGKAWLISGLGLWLIVAAFLPMTIIDTAVHNLLIGAVVAGSSWLLRCQRPVQGWCGTLLGVWLAGVAAWSGLGAGHPAQWSTVAAGIAFTILGLTAVAGKVEFQRARQSGDATAHKPVLR